TAIPAPPLTQSFWVVSSGSGTLFWSPSDLRGEQLSLVVMSPTADRADQVLATAAMLPRWLDPTTYGLLILGTVAFLIGMVLLFLPRRHREIVYAGQPGTYRSFSAPPPQLPPQITPSFAASSSRGATHGGANRTIHPNR